LGHGRGVVVRGKLYVREGGEGKKVKEGGRMERGV